MTRFHTTWMCQGNPLNVTLTSQSHENVKTSVIQLVMLLAVILQKYTIHYSAFVVSRTE